jgi:hypothetical protein
MPESARCHAHTHRLLRDFFSLSSLHFSAQDNSGQSYWAARSAGSVHALVDGFNRIGGHAAQMRSAMSPSDAQVFDAVMLDMMSAIEALAGIGLPDKRKTGAIRPATPRPDRIPQLQPEMEGLVRFFERLRKSATSRADRRLFASAAASSRQMLAALPAVLPTISAVQAPAQRK